MTDILEKWQKYCDANGLEREGAAARLGLHFSDYYKILNGKAILTEKIQVLMSQLIDRKVLINKTVLETRLLKQMEDDIKTGLDDKVLITGTCPTGMGKTTAAKFLASKYNCKYYFTLTELKRDKKAAKKNFIRALARAYNLNDRSTNAESHLINKLLSNERSFLILDESQRLKTEDWGYFQVIQDIYDNVPNLSILMLGNFDFFNTMFTNADRVYDGISDDEQFLRRISSVKRYSKLTAGDVKLWFEYNNMPLRNPNEYKRFAEYFKVRAGLDDLEKIRKELIKNLGKGTLRRITDASFDEYKSIHKILHKDFQFDEEENVNAQTKKVV